MRRLALAALIPSIVAPAACLGQGGHAPPMLCPITRHIHIAYDVPVDAPDEVRVLCEWSPRGADQWQPAPVTPLISETALRLVSNDTWAEWRLGRVLERRAAGLRRTVVFDPYPDAQTDGIVDADFRIRVETTGGRPLTTHTVAVQADNTDVVYIEDWSQVIQKGLLDSAAEPEDRKWRYVIGSTDAELSGGTGLFGSSPADVGLRPLTYPLDLTGVYAIHTSCKPHYGVRIRLTGDERSDLTFSDHPRQQTLWKWARMDRQHIVIEQTHNYTGYCTSHVDYVKLVPLADGDVAELEAGFGSERDKTVVGYWEPYSWAFGANVVHPLQHREPLRAFADASVDVVDSQIGRFGAKMVFETRRTDQLLYSTTGDPTDNDASPTTDNVGRMQQYTNTLDATLRYCRDLGVTAHANFGATNCYPGSPLEGDVSKEHPEWRRGSALRYELPEVREFILGLYREALEIGARGLSVDFCRYPEGIDTAETCTTFLRELRALASEFSTDEPVSILVRFPGRGVRQWKMFGWQAWVDEKLVDTICPSNIQGRHMHIDARGYVLGAAGSGCKVMPVLDGLHWGLEWPGMVLWRARQLHEQGVDGIYVYQADSRVLGHPLDQRAMRMLGSSDGLESWWASDAALRPSRSKGIYISDSSYEKGYHGWERLRVWLEGIEMGRVEIYLDGELITKADGPPYVLGSEEYETDGVIPPGDHELRIRARDGDGWFEQVFTITGV